MNFQKSYKGLKRYYPDTDFNYQFEHIENEEEREYLLIKLEEKKQSIKKELDKLFRGKRYAVSGTTKKYPCILDKTCTFLGSKFSRHCKSKLHYTTEKQGRFLESFLNHSVQYITLIVKAGSRKPTLCEKCEMFYERITSHMQHQHKLKPGTPSFIRTLEQNQTRTQEWIEQVYQAYEDSDEDHSDNEDSAEDHSDNEENEEPEPKRARIQKDPEHQSTEEGGESDAEAQKEKNGQSEKKKEKKDKESEKKDKEKKHEESDRKQEKKDKESDRKPEKKDKESVKKQEKKEKKKVKGKILHKAKVPRNSSSSNQHLVQILP